MQLPNTYANERPSPLHRPTVLLVEDNDDLRTEVAALLREDGYAVTEAPDGAQGLGLLRTSPIDIVLLDLWLPVIDGWTFRAEQLSDETLRDIPVIVMTADGRAQARAIDADAILHKPFQSDALCTTIRRVLADRSVQGKAATEGVSEAVTLLASAIGHEVANPLMSLIYNLETFRTDPDASSEANIEQRLEECSRIASCLHVLRDLPCPTWTREGDVNLDRVIRSAIGRASTDGTRVVLESDGAAWVRGDPLVVLYLCTALLRNAIEAVPDSERAGQSEVDADTAVRVHLRRSASEIVLDVLDFGVAIPEEDLSRVFAPSSTGRGRAWGSGFRLSFAQKIVGMLGGLIEISNAPDGGVLCRVRLPASSPQ